MTKELQVRKQSVPYACTPVSQIEWRLLFWFLAHVTVSLKHFENASSFAPKYAAALTAASGHKSGLSGRQNIRLFLCVDLNQFNCEMCSCKRIFIGVNSRLRVETYLVIFLWFLKNVYVR